MAFRILFFAFMAWLLVWFLPGHKRGMITLGPREADACCAPQPVRKMADCCAQESAATHREPTSKDRAKCAVCFWAAGLLTSQPFAIDLSHAERAFRLAQPADAQVRLVACRLNQYGRDPPPEIAGSIVI